MAGAKNIKLDALNTKGGNMHCVYLKRNEAKAIEPCRHKKSTLLIFNDYRCHTQFNGFPLISGGNRVIGVTDCEQN